MIKIYTFGTGNLGPGGNRANRASLIALALLALGAASLFLVLGLALLTGLVVVGGVLGTGLSIYNRIRGRRLELPTGLHQQQSPGLDPSLEVFPEPRGQLGQGDSNS